MYFGDFLNCTTLNHFTTNELFKLPNNLRMPFFVPMSSKYIANIVEVNGQEEKI